MRAILSVYDKTGIAELAKGLHELGWELFSTGRTQSAIAEAGVPVASIAEMTGSPEMLEGRVKTLHPKVHGGLLARRDREDDTAELAEHGIEPIDLVAGNLYPFIDTVSGTDVSLAEALEEIDIGGPTMIRAAAKNHPWVIPIVDPSDYAMIIEALRAGGLDAGQRRALAAKAFAHVSHYDAAIAEYLRGEDDLLPEQLTLAMTRVEVMRYGENPHQQWRLLHASTQCAQPVEGIGGFEQHHGQGDVVRQLPRRRRRLQSRLRTCPQGAAVAIIKHTNPCLLRRRLRGRRARRRSTSVPCWPRATTISAYGGIVAGQPTDRLRLWRTALRAGAAIPSHRRVRMRYRHRDRARATRRTVWSTCKQKVEATCASSTVLRRVKRDASASSSRGIRGAMLLQHGRCLRGNWTFDVTSERERRARAELEPILRLAWVVCKHVKSNAVAFVKDGVLVGMGAGQPNRVGSARLCQQQAGERARGAVAATDAFIPFPDTIEVCAEAGCTVIAHTGGSIRDEDSIETANRLGVSLVTTGARHFRH